MARRIPASGINLFQLIYVFQREYTESTGLAPLNLSLGNPDGVPVEALRKLQAQYAADPGYEYHTYAEENDLLGFAPAMAELHGRIRVAEHPRLKAMPIPGIKTATALIPIACGLHLPDRKRRDKFTVVSNLPAYDVIGTWSQSYLGARRVVWPLLAGEGMRLSVPRLKAALREAKVKRPDLVFVIRPGNPASVGASAREWRELIAFCLENGSRLVNDAAYAGLAGDSHVPLAAVAKDFPDLDWLELYSVSKSFSDPGARLGAVLGSKDFIEDLALVKGNSESGPVPSVMAAYGRFLSTGAEAREALDFLRRMYADRLAYLVPRLKSAGLRQACETEAGFFTLWKVPRRVLGKDLAAWAKKKDLSLHEAFNRLVTSETGIVGVHFQGFSDGGSREPLIRYAVCADVLDPGFKSRFEKELAAKGLTLEDVRA
ncbi:MAG: pyridoxal phosphate-dependent aminotransferase, partial [Elusimicrobiota bacterium]